ncbi:MAG: bifunctional (p)ppGpp synthetase/guanosine-3',5'-bis(diphosphate) 3'-pyrophosphohydrolase [Prevotella sp.]|nr:bifunctional (p)ppGpp synthetase/guanosine-3',5'-bis(diphosphate) 3'-pyrophosphohydrolase [Prevotella sp.]
MANAPIDTSLLDRAIMFAVKAHAGTERRGKGFPYIVHPMEAVEIVATITPDQELLAAAALHDTVEDTDVTIEQIREEFGGRVARLVQNESCPLPKGAPWRDRKQAQLDQLANASRDSKIVAMGDKLSNLRTISADYRQIGDALWQRFKAPNGKEDVAWYYHQLAEALSDLAGTAPYEEYLHLLDITFGPAEKSC